jgi:hypothetical protein
MIEHVVPGAEKHINTVRKHILKYIGITQHTCIKKGLCTYFDPEVELAFTSGP